LCGQRTSSFAKEIGEAQGTKSGQGVASGSIHIRAKAVRWLWQETDTRTSQEAKVKGETISPENASKELRGLMNDN
jgi:hypothetical protein